MKLPALPPVLRNPLVLGAGALVALIGLAALARKPGAGGGLGWGPPPLVGPSDRVLLIGDSLAAGLTKPMKALAEGAGNPYQGHGVVGSRIDEWDSKYLAPELDFAPTVAIISLGTNDMKMFDPTTQQPAHVQAILSKLRAAGARVAWIIPPTMPFSDKGVRQMIAGAGADLVIHAENLDLPRSEDKIHMTPSGYQKFAESVWNCVTLGQCP